MAEVADFAEQLTDAMIQAGIDDGVEKRERNVEGVGASSRSSIWTFLIWQKNVVDSPILTE